MTNDVVMPVAPVNGGGGFGGFGDNGWWIILLFLAFGGFGNGGYNSGEVQRGFDQAAIQSQIGDFATATGGGINSLQNQISNDRFDTVTAINTTGNLLNNTMMQNEMNRQQCCCETKQAIADLKYTVATENCADRAALNDAIRDVMVQNTANTQAILDRLCQQEIDAKNETIANLRTQLNMANLSASQTAQTSILQAGNQAQTTYIVDALRPTPIPAYIVANPNTGTTTPATGA